ncbi:MAG: hypothetical protein ACI3WS_05405 [Phascolarctobacterium sp.]
MEEIYIKAWYGVQKPATPEQALRFAKKLYRIMPTGCRHGGRVELINKHHLRGIRFTESELM